ncbi:HNH endonuclease [Carex littledalei]|uniref:HNH endonuclease n=1 Tax=Carex littledalei TaxID=544730 RepID=A0A833VHE5_9POAL|nr:HNH endonuclease [Carex littledalei]
MAPRRHGRGYGKNRPNSNRDRKRSPASPPSALLLDDSSTFIMDDDRDANPRSFPFSVKQQCWEKAEKVKGRDPDRWRRDALGNIVFRKLVGCPGCLCHDYDHILPYSKGGRSTLENCQVLQATVNRSKGNNTEVSRSDLMQKSAYCRVSGRDMDLLELSAFGNVRRGPDSGGCNIQ